MRTQLQSLLPAGMPEHHGDMDKMHEGMEQHTSPDAGELLLHALMPAPHHMPMMMGGGMRR